MAKIAFYDATADDENYFSQVLSDQALAFSRDPLTASNVAVEADIVSVWVFQASQHVHGVHECVAPDHDQTENLDHAVAGRVKVPAFAHLWDWRYGVAPPSCWPSAGEGGVPPTGFEPVSRT